jgi:hypothetical protein
MKSGTRVQLLDNPETRQWLSQICFWDDEIAEKLIRHKTTGTILKAGAYPDVFLVDFPGTPYYCRETAIDIKFLKIIK